MTEPQDPLIPKNNKDEAESHEIGADNLAGETAGGACEPPTTQSEEKHPSHQQPKALSYTSIAFSIAAIVVSVFAARYAYQQVEVAKDQVKVAKDTARKQLRAYVHAVPNNVYYIDGVNPLQAYVGIRNAGQTFAHDVERTIIIKLDGANVSEEALGLVEPEPGKFVIGPGGTNITIKSFHRPLTPDESEQIMATPESRTDEKDLRIYVIGKITYKDVWGDSHITDFCFTYFDYPHIQRLKDKFYRGTLHGKYCDKYNSAD